MSCLSALYTTSVGPGSLKGREQAGRNRCRYRKTQAMNVDREDELRIHAPPGAASASESRLLLDRAGLAPEAQREKNAEKTRAHSQKKKSSQTQDAICGEARAKSLMREPGRPTWRQRSGSCSLFESLGKSLRLKHLRPESRGESLPPRPTPAVPAGAGRER